MRILAIDLGTTSVKLMRMDEHAQILSIDHVRVAGLSVDTWVAILRENLAAHGDQSDVVGIAVTGQMHGLMTREMGDRWGEGIAWHDTRSADLIPAIREAVGADAVTTTGGPIAPGFLGASLAWIRQHDAERWSRITRVHLPKDALIHELTGEHVTDPSDAVGTGLYAPEGGDWAWPIVDALGIPGEWLPRLMPLGSIAGGLREEYASLLGLPRGLPIILAGGDAPTGAYGAGVTRDSDALVMLSTGAQVIVPSRTWSPDPEGRWYTWPSVAPETTGFAPYLRVGTLLNAGNVIRWAETVLADRELGEGPSGLVALPHLMGTREDPARSGALIGMTDTTTARDIRRSLVEGVAFSVRQKLEEMTGTGQAPSRILIGGGLAHRPDIRHLFADVLGTPVETVDQPDVTAYGAGLLALRNLTGLVPEGAVDTGDVTVPNTIESYDAPYALFRELDRVISPFASQIASLRDERS